MPSNPTTLAELIAKLEAESARERYLGTYGDSADLMDRAAKVLRAVETVRHYGANAPGSAAWATMGANLDAAITRALGGSDAG